MYRHISLFRLSDDADKQANIEAFRKVNEALPEQESSLVSVEVGTALVSPVLSPGGQIFYDVAQILTFNTLEDCMNWVDTPAHTDLRAFSSGMVELVGIIDYEVK